jgi:hypothetical protein
MHKVKLHLTIVLILAIGAACRSQNVNSTNNPALENNTSSDARAPTPTATLAPTNSPPPEEDSSVSDELPPMTFEEILVTGIDSGSWTEGEGLVQILKYFVGETPQESVSDISAVEELAGTGIIRRAGDYLNARPRSRNSRGT